MPIDVNGTPAVSHTDHPNVGTPAAFVCWCGTTGCNTPEQCRRDYYSSETTWREIARRPAARSVVA